MGEPEVRRDLWRINSLMFNMFKTFNTPQLLAACWALLDVIPIGPGPEPLAWVSLQIRQQR
jgi:hypothetical protein